MNLLSRLSIRANMVLFTLVAMIAMLTLTVIAMVNQNDSDQLAEGMLTDVQLARATGNADMMHDGLLASVLAAQLAGPQAPEAQKAALRAELQERASIFESTLADIDAAAPQSLRRSYENVRPKALAYIDTARQLVAAALAGNVSASQKQTFQTAFSALEVELDQLSELVEAGTKVSIKRKDDIHSKASTSMIVATICSGLFIMGFSFAFARSTLNRLGAEPTVLSGFARRIADGDLNAQLAERVHGASVAGAMLRMRDTLRSTVQQIRGNAQSVASASGQIAQGNSDLSGRTEHQASALQQTAASMEQLSGTVQQNAGNAQQANQLALGASEVASKGGTVVGQVVETMKGIHDASNRIADIISVIDGIAFQTNILALNAAVEAARAGEQGRGFAVVASEVRGLARRSADAAKEIKSLIDASVDRVARGSTLVDEAGSTMGEVVRAIKRVTDIMADISQASSEQSDGVGQINQAISQMDQTTQQNAALVEQNAAAAQHLQEQAQQLLQAVATFKMGQDLQLATAAA